MPNHISQCPRAARSALHSAVHYGCHGHLYYTASYRDPEALLVLAVGTAVRLTVSLCLCVEDEASALACGVVSSLSSTPDVRTCSGCNNSGGGFAHAVS